MQRQHIAQPQDAFAFHPGRDATLALGGRPEPLALTGQRTVDGDRRLLTGQVFHIDNQRHAVWPLQAA